MSLEHTIRQMMSEAVDPTDTGGAEEASMAMRQVKAIRHFADGIEQRVAQQGDMEEWYQNKLTKAHDYLKTLYSYGKGDPVKEEVELTEEQIKVGDYQTKHFDICPGATSLYKKIEATPKAVESAKLQDQLFALEKKAIESDSATEEDVDKAEELADKIMSIAKEMGMEKEHGYVQGHVDKIDDIEDKDEEKEMDEAKVRGKEVYDKTFANRTQADNYAKKHGGRVQQVGRVFYVFKEELEEAKSKEQQIADLEKMLDRISGNTSSVKMKKFALQKKIDKLKSEDLEEKKDEPPFDVSTADYKGAAKELTQYAKTKGGMDKDDFLSFANRMSEIDKRKSPKVMAKFARDLEALDTSPREKIVSVMRNNGIKVKMGNRGLVIEDMVAEDWDFLDSLNEAVNMAKVRSTYNDIMKGGRRGPPDDDEVGDYIGKGMTKADIAALIKMLAKQGYDAKFLTKDLAPLAEAYKTPSEASAYEAGKKAVAKKVSYDDNPNKKGTKEYTAWSKGHNDARAKMIGKRFSKEEDELDELSPATHKRYQDAAFKDAARGRAQFRMGTRSAKSAYDKEQRRYKGIDTSKYLNRKQHGVKEEVELEEAKRDPSKSGGTGYDLYHKDFSSAMKHAYDYAKKKFGIEIDPTEIDDKVASGPRKPSSGKTNSYRLKGKDGKKAVQIQVSNLDNKRYELNMYKESVEMELDENAGLIKDYQGMKAQGKKDSNILDALMSMPKYKRMSKDQMAKIIGDAKRKGIFKEEVELDEAMRVLATKGKTKVVTKGDGVARVMVGNKEVASGDFDDGADGWFMSKKGDKGQKFFDSAKKIVDFYAEELSATQRLRALMDIEVPVTEQKMTVGQSIMEKAIARIREAEGEKMTDAEMKKRDEIMKGLEKKKDEFVDRYGDRAKEVMARTAIKMAKGD